MRVLIDTHYVLWAAIHSKRMEPWARKVIADLENEILVSAASVYEISLKVRLGKLPEAVAFESDLIENIESRLGYTLLPLEPESMMRAARFEQPHADPFDRMIAAATQIQNNLPVLSTDPKLESFRRSTRCRSPSDRKALSLPSRTSITACSGATQNRGHPERGRGICVPSGHLVAQTRET